MAKIEDLIQQIPDERLRKGIADEVKALKKTKKFGLVFEEHLPEMVRLPHLPVKPGELVAVKSESGNRLWRVKTIEKKIAVCDAAVEGYPSHKETNREFPVSALVVVRSFGEPIYPALVPVDRVERGGPDKPWHLLINADNFHALQLLLYCYEGKVDVIYIDPPYNTGARDWKYNNSYVDKNDSFRHSKWLSMIKKRLMLAKRLLKPDGVLVVTIDDIENAHLGILLDEIFSDHVRVPIVIKYNRQGTPRMGLNRIHEYAHFITRREISRERGEGYVTTRNFRRNGMNSARAARPTMFFPIYISKSEMKVLRAGEAAKPDFHPSKQTFDTGNEFEIWPIDEDGIERNWNWSGVRVNKKQQDLAAKKKGEKVQVYFQTVNHPVDLSQTLWADRKHDASTFGSSLVQAIIGKRFPFPKSLYAVADVLRLCCSANKDALVLDFFGGSGTTFHATAYLNKRDGGNRQSIIVTNNEVEDRMEGSLEKSGLFPGDEQFEKEGICESITWPRCRLSTLGVTHDGTPIQGAYEGLDCEPADAEFSKGLDENIEYFRLNFLNPDSVARGDAFAAILPILWMMAGCHGKREDSKGSQDWFIPKHAPFAVLIKEKEFRAFRGALAERKDIGWIFLVTDSEENFGLMRRALGRKFQCVQLYKNYLENFRINTPEALGQGGAA
jgi:adenine-specific DNA-methyltransferase